VITIQFTGATSTDTNADVSALQIIPQPSTPTPTWTVPACNTSSLTLGNTSAASAGSAGAGGYIGGTNYTLSQPMTVTSLNFYFSSGTSGNGVVGIYSDAGGRPSQLMVQSNAQNLTAGANNFVVTPTILSAGSYWIYGSFNGTVNWQYSSSCCAGGYLFGTYTYSGGLPTTITSGSLTGYGWTMCAYASGCTQPTATPTKSPTAMSCGNSSTIYIGSDASNLVWTNCNAPTATPGADGSGNAWNSANYNTSTASDWYNAQIISSLAGGWTAPCSIAGSGLVPNWISVISTASQGNGPCNGTNGQLYYYAKNFTVPAGTNITSASLLITGDDGTTGGGTEPFGLYVNGNAISVASLSWNACTTLTIPAADFHSGSNIITFMDENETGGQGIAYQLSCALEAYTCTFTNTPTNTVTQTPTYTFTSTNSNTPTNTFTTTTTYTPTSTPTTASTSSSTVTYTSSNTPTSTYTLTKTYTSTPINTSTPTLTNTLSITSTPSSTATVTVSSTATNSPVGTWTPVPTSTFTNTNTITATYTVSFTTTPTSSSTVTSTFTNTVVNTATKTPSTTSTLSYTFTPTTTVTNTLTSTRTATLTSTNSFTSTLTATPTTTYTFTFTKTPSPMATWTNTSTWTPIPEVPTATYTFTVTPTYTHTAVPPTSTPTLVGCSGIPNWNGNFVAYSVGQKVDYNGEIYQCIQAHTSEPNWMPPVVPALWKDLGPCGSTPVAALVAQSPVVFPNPVTSSTANLQLPMTNATDVKVQIFTIAFREVKIVTEAQVMGNTMTVSLIDKVGMQLANGLYYFVIQADGQKWINKVMVLR
jgi:hypothetical protein